MAMQDTQAQAMQPEKAMHPEKVESTIGLVISQLEDTIQTMLDEIDTLGSTIAPILRESGPREVAQDTPAYSGSDVQTALAARTARLQTGVQNLRDLRRRVDL